MAPYTRYLINSKALIINENHEYNRFSIKNKFFILLNNFPRLENLRDCFAKLRIKIMLFVLK